MADILKDPPLKPEPDKPAERRMTQFKITTPDGQSFVVSAPEGVPEEKVLSVIYGEAQKLGMYKPEPVAPTPEGQGLLDTLKRQHEKNKAAKAQLQHPVVGAIEGALPSALTAASIPLTAGGGALAAKALPQIPRLAAAGGRALTQGAMGSAEAALEGRSPVRGGAMDTASALLTEGVMTIAPHLARIPGLTRSIATIAEELGSRHKAYEYATKAIGQAFEAVKDRIPKGAWMNLPSLDKTKRLTAKEAQAGLENLERIDYEVARKEIISELNRLDIRNLPKRMLGGQAKAPRPYAGQEFEMRSSPSRFQPTPTTGEKVASGATKTLQDPFMRAAADTATTQTKVDGVPFGALAAATMAGPLLRHAPGGRAVERLVVGEEPE